MRKSKKFLTVFLTLTVGITALTVSIPTVLTVTNSFMSQGEISYNYGLIFSGDSTSYMAEGVKLKLIPDMVSFSQYYITLFQSPEYLLKFWNSDAYVVPIVVFQVLIALLAAYSFSRFRSKGKEILLFIYTILMLMPYQVTMVPNYIVADALNFVNTRWSIWFPGITSPFSVYLLTKFMRKIPMSYYEAAKIDGAREWAIFTKISLPICKSAIASVVILVFIDYWNMVEQPILMLSDVDLYPLSVYLAKINAEEVGIAFAVAVVYMFLPILIFLYGEDYLVEGIVYSGGIKG